MAKPALMLLLLTFSLSAISCASSGQPKAPAVVACPMIQPLTPQEKAPRNLEQKLREILLEPEPSPTPTTPTL